MYPCIQMKRTFTKPSQGSKILKVGSRRAAEIKSLVILIIILVALILLPYYMYVVLVLILLFLLVSER